ncbi:mannosyltransferase OCH1-like enzyme [Pedobacter sp. CAN_A7]|uniref:glycosyltransferase family 32 protein n=1 Tax=Pedobacter sp. CAN_A7 TaxID=2787722 RepID=UPI0018CB7C7E
MPIPKIIHQTFKTAKFHFLTRWHIARLRKKNPDYVYEFYDDDRIDRFIQAEYDNEVFSLYKRINIGAAKADFFRYAVLYKKGGVYLDIDSAIKGKLSDFILPTDVAVISKERNEGLFVQWALIFEAHHPFLKKTLELVLENLRTNKYKHDVHKMTGPQVYSNAINLCLKENPDSPYRLFGTDYEGHLKFKYPFSKLLYEKGEHWKKKQLTTPVMRDKETDQN